MEHYGYDVLRPIIELLTSLGTERESGSISDSEGSLGTKGSIRRAERLSLHQQRIQYLERSTLEVRPCEGMENVVYLKAPARPSNSPNIVVVCGGTGIKTFMGCLAGHLYDTQTSTDHVLQAIDSSLLDEAQRHNYNLRQLLRAFPNEMTNATLARHDQHLRRMVRKSRAYDITLLLKTKQTERRQGMTPDNLNRPKSICLLEKLLNPDSKPVLKHEPLPIIDFTMVQFQSELFDACDAMNYKLGTTFVDDPVCARTVITLSQEERYPYCRQLFRAQRFFAKMQRLPEYSFNDDVYYFNTLDNRLERHASMQAANSRKLGLDSSQHLSVAEVLCLDGPSQETSSSTLPSNPNTQTRMQRKDSKVSPLLLQLRLQQARKAPTVEPARKASILPIRKTPIEPIALGSLSSRRSMVTRSSTPEWIGPAPPTPLFISLPLCELIPFNCNYAICLDEAWRTYFPSVSKIERTTRLTLNDCRCCASEALVTVMYGTRPCLGIYASTYPRSKRSSLSLRQLCNALHFWGKDDVLDSYNEKERTYNALPVELQVELLSLLNGSGLHTSRPLVAYQTPLTLQVLVDLVVDGWTRSMGPDSDPFYSPTERQVYVDPLLSILHLCESVLQDSGLMLPARPSVGRQYAHDVLAIENDVLSTRTVDIVAYHATYEFDTFRNKQ
ncbi:hypothetical protein GMRT_10120 [Giardia muris]|uniref:Uncharacterized protein n=1 Tax=Giardia muris TaxID=5742 RepID=A0A4Z1SQ30_GIAMU|nr:hypothetical protein GMRT_10120 [Giardia muris]|eukprot:TNJ27770.1 hypothetical protein GMRT_10120 [Giardia muris]